MHYPIRTLLVCLMSAYGVAFAAPQDEKAAELSREAALDNLLSERESPEALATVITEARANGIGEQAILEARFLYHVDRREDETIAAMLPEFLKQRKSFKLEDSVIFGLKEDWLAVVEYVQAIAALEKGDKPGFKHHITEAFWLSPRQAAAFAPHIERMRLEESMQSVKIDFTASFHNLMGDGKTALDQLTMGKKALLLHFWSPWSRECEAFMPDFVATADLLVKADIAVVSLLPDDSTKQLADARSMISRLAGKASCKWVVDSNDRSFSRDLRVRNLPTMILVSQEGLVLYNGDPTDEEFWVTLGKMDPAIQRPNSKSDESK